MDDSIRLRTWVRACDSEIRTGLLGYISVHYGPFIIDGLVLRKTASGKLTLAFPSRTDRGGRRHFYVRPDGDEARQTVEREILQQLTQREDPEPAGGSR